MDSPPPLVVLNDGLGGEMSFKTIEGCLIVDHIKAYFGNNVAGISYQPADSTSNGHQPKQTSVFISLGDSERIELPAHVEEYQVHYQQKDEATREPVLLFIGHRRCSVLLPPEIDSCTRKTP
ncbi:hypothetical protein QAD02_003784 [Eretmocerus hayati]|uniref:Uncharacterized protein n=1 Tax=Eretmocerus hayati TaxID=131215 RepID=A0ACC2NSJ9_9HYME|nr:hypothetical protein QAD02_003784 [Eretmocerus hayati]